MSKIRTSLAAAMLAFAQSGLNTIANPGYHLTNFLSKFHFKKSGKGRSTRMQYDWRNHYTTPWKELLEKDHWIGGGMQERARRVRQMERNSLQMKKRVHIHV